MKMEVDTIVMDAINEAGLLHQTYLGSEHLLLAILKNNQFRITKLLNQHGMNYANVRNDVLELNYQYGSIPTTSGYSFAVIQILKKCDSSTSMIIEMLLEKDSLANSLLQRYAIPIEKLIN